jgi:XTP/dITP diphosphohydrolase
MRKFEGDKIVLATHNAGKLEEIRDLIGPLGIKVVSAGELGLPEPPENGVTFEENAATKADAASMATGLVAFSDDSGIVVDALDGAPGVYTADWAEKEDGSRDFGIAMQKVEDALSEANATEPEQRTARFVSVLCMRWPDGHREYFRGEAEGQLVWPPRGTSGFGYDPVFKPNDYDVTFGEMTAEEKHGWKPGDEDALSHRARAFKLFAETCLDR